MNYISFEITLARNTSTVEARRIAENKVREILADNPSAVEVEVCVMHDGYQLARAGWYA